MGTTAAEIKFVRSLKQKKFRKESKLFVIEGVKPVTELLNSALEVDRVFATDMHAVPFDNIQSVSEKELGRMSSLKSPNKVLALAKIPDHKLSFDKSWVLVLDGIKDPGNLGTIIRTAKWFGVDDISCINDCVDAYDRKVVQSTMGALFQVNLVYLPEDDALGTLKKNEFSLIGTSMDGDSIYNAKFVERTALVIGSESHGMSDSIRVACNKLISIPNLEEEQSIESLNAAIATSIVLSEVTRP